jgi:putative hemolysin
LLESFFNTIHLDESVGYSFYNITLNYLQIIETNFILYSLIIIVLLGFSAFISGAELSFFSLTQKHIDELKETKTNTSNIIILLLKRPKILLATILIANNAINISIVILSSILSARLFSFIDNEILDFMIQVVLVTFVLLLFGEVIPKVYATSNPLILSRFMSYPLIVLRYVFYPLSYLMVNTTKFIDKRIKLDVSNISVDDLSHALELTNDEETNESEKELLKGIVKFGSLEARQIMKSRTNINAIEHTSKYSDVIKIILDSGFSRIPVYKESIDNIVGILFIKDLITYIDKDDDFEWQQLLRTPFFIPENKKIDDLLAQFQEKKIHLAVVIDEYGGTSGIVTMEDILEEVVGEISDEYDEDDAQYVKINSNTFIFEAQTALNDVFKILKINSEDFDNVRGEAETLAGLLLEIEGRIPPKNTKIQVGKYTFVVEAVDNRKIKSVKIIIDEVVEK